MRLSIDDECADADQYERKSDADEDEFLDAQGPEGAEGPSEGGGWGGSGGGGGGGGEVDALAVSESLYLEVLCVFY